MTAPIGAGEVLHDSHDPAPGDPAAAHQSASAPSLEDVVQRLTDGPARGLPADLWAGVCARSRATATAAGTPDAAGGRAAAMLGGDLLVELALEGRLEAGPADAVIATVAASLAAPAPSARLEVFSRACTTPTLLEVPPVVAVDAVLRLLVSIGVVEMAGLWRREPEAIACLGCVGGAVDDADAAAAARTTLDPTAPEPEPGSTGVQTAVVVRLGIPDAVLVARTAHPEPVQTYLAEAARALRPVLERDVLLGRGSDREELVTRAAERRLTRLGFDIHDGPVQEILALAEDLRSLRDQLLPFVAEEQRTLASGRFDDTLHRLVELDRSLRELSHSLESRSIVARPLSEILHREVSRFEERTGIGATLEIEGDAESLSASQRIVVYRAVQESLTNIREHSGADRVDLRVRAARGAVEVEITDDGRGFEVEQALARAAQRGRLGIVGIGERVQMLGGTFAIESRPGGPTTLRLALPRWDRLQALPG